MTHLLVACPKLSCMSPCTLPKWLWLFRQSAMYLKNPSQSKKAYISRDFSHQECQRGFAQETRQYDEPSFHPVESLNGRDSDEWVILWMSHVSHLNESCHENESWHTWMSHLTYIWVILHMNESYVTYEWVVSRRWVVTHINVSSCTWISHVSHMNESSHGNDTCYFKWGIKES